MSYLSEAVDVLSNSTVNSIVVELGEIYKTATSNVNVVTSVASSLCALFAVFWIGDKIWKSWCQGGSIDIYSCFRPFVIGFICLNFSFFVTFLDTIANAIIEPTTTLVQSQAKVCKGKITAYEEKVKQQKIKEEQEKEKDDGILSGISASAIGEGVGTALQDFALTCVCICCFIAMIAVLIFSLIVKVILVYFGPVVFAFAITPMFSGMIGSWVSRFLNCSLTIGIINMVNFVMLQFYSHVISIQLNVITESGSEAGSSCAGGGLLLVVGIIGIVLYMCVPSLSSMIIESAGASALTGQATATVGSGAKTVGGYSAKKVGGTARSAVKGMFSVASVQKK